MKKIIASMFACLFMLSCADDSWKQELEDIKAELANQKQLIEALQQNSTITGIEQGNGQYTIKFSDGQAITLTNGKTPIITIGENGNWFIDGVDTGKPSKGEDGADGVDGSNGTNGEDGTDGTNGTDGKTPTIEIGVNGNWIINGTDTEVKAEGVDGKDAPNIISILNNPNELVFIFSDNSSITVPLSIKQYPHYGKNLFCVGDSFTMQGTYFNSLINTTGLIKIGDTGGDGNGQPLTGYYKLIEKYKNEISKADFVTILGGVNDYLHGSDRLGDFSNTSESNTIYGAIKKIVETIMLINPNITIVFFSQPECGKYGDQPYNTTPPEANGLGLTMENISIAMEDCCKRLGVPFFNTHATLWNFYQIHIYTGDNLHPNKIGGEKIGQQMGRYINSL